MISIDDFKIVVENTPLISIDFIVEYKDKYLLGKRVNSPAKDYYFTPGGRIFKDESIKKAIKRLSKKELNLEVSKEKLEFYGVYEHFYKDSFVDKNISTHYVVLVYKMKIDIKLNLPNTEHNKYYYFSRYEILNNNSVHKYVKDYFKGDD